MKAQFLFIFSILLLSIYISIIFSFKNDYKIYEINLEKYVAYDFYLKIKLLNDTFLNSTFYDYCKKLLWDCLYNETHIIVKSPTKIYVLNIT